GWASPELYYNIGNSYFKTGEIGKSILYYERALRLGGNDNDVLANLALVRSLTLDEISPLPEFWLFRAIRWWVGLIPQRPLRRLMAFTYVLLIGLIAARVLTTDRSVKLRLERMAYVNGIIAIALGLNLLATEGELLQSEEAIVMLPEVDVNSAPLADPTLKIFEIHEGTKVRIDQRAENWTEIVLLDGNVGWVPSAALERI
ncbi:MAG: tetratricopeptide repeat protein, partial [Gemmatimonadales bacterium]